jgi:hypothetical protein
MRVHLEMIDACLGALLTPVAGRLGRVRERRELPSFCIMSPRRNRISVLYVNLLQVPPSTARAWSALERHMNE